MNEPTDVFIAHAVMDVLELLLILRAMLRPHRDPASRIAWVAVIASLPGIGMLAYLLLGETNIGRRRVEGTGRGIGAAGACQRRGARDRLPRFMALLQSTPPLLAPLQRAPLPVFLLTLSQARLTGLPN